MAGESAGELARRQREKAARLIKSADLYEKGAEGERRTAAVLDQLGVYGYVALHDLAWPGRQRANIDHVLIGPSGVYVVDSKNWTGRIVVAQGTVMQNGRRRDQAVASVGDSALALAAVLGRDVTPVMCFVRDDDVAGRAHEVLVTSTGNLHRLIMSRPAVMSPYQTSALVQQLRHGVRAAVHPRAKRTVQPWQNFTYPASTVQPSKPRATRKTREMRRAAVGLVGALLVLLMLPKVFQWLPNASQGIVESLLDQTAQSSDAPSLQFGTLFSVPDSNVRVAVGTPRRVIPDRKGAYVPQGKRLVGVPVRMRNMGQKVWKPRGLLRSRGEDSAGNRASHWGGTGIKAGSLFPDVRSLRPGRQIKGFVVFAVPWNLELDAVSLSLNSFGKPFVVWS